MLEHIANPLKRFVIDLREIPANDHVRQPLSKSGVLDDFNLY